MIIIVLCKLYKDLTFEGDESPYNYVTRDYTLSRKLNMEVFLRSKKYKDNRIFFESSPFEKKIFFDLLKKQIFIGF